MDIHEIKKIIELMKENEISEFELEEDEFRIAVKRSNGQEQQVVVSAPAAPMVMPQAAPSAAATAPGTETIADVVAKSEEDQGETIKSPMVGTFYRSPSPDQDAFIKVGDEVDEDTVVCIVEAMKVMNEIKAETKGVIKKVLVDNASPVEFGQALFLVEPA